MWTSTYAPRSLGEIALSPDIRRRVQGWIDSGDIPHALFHGPPGVGKTSVARVIAASTNTEFFYYNNGRERELRFVRGELHRIARILMALTTPGGLKLVALDEADSLTAPAQEALRGVIDTSHETRFILLTNNEKGLSPALRSRCLMVEFASPPADERVRLLRRILRAENHEVAPDEIRLFAEQHVDVRQMLMQAKDRIGTYGRLVPEGMQREF